MFYQRQRLQVLGSLLVIIVTLLYLGQNLVAGSRPAPAAQTSQLGEAMFLIRYSYVQEVNEEVLLRSGAEALLARARESGARDLPEWTPTAGVAPDAALNRLELFLDRVAGQCEASLTREQAVYATLDGITKALGDPYSKAMDPRTYARFQEHLHSLPYGGVGLTLEHADGRFIVVEVREETPAAVSGVTVNDELLEIDGQTLQDLSLEEVKQRLWGEIRTRVKLKLRRAPGSETYELDLERVQLRTRTVHTRLLGKIGWISISSMADTTGQDINAAVDELNARGARGFVLDLRENVGGYLTAALEVASVFLPSGRPVVTVETRTDREPKHTIGERVEEKPMLVLVSRRTASSAEILAGALQDYRRAELWGEVTFGKGSIQTLHDFADGGGFKLTTSRYVTPLGHQIEQVGLQPDRTLPASVMESDKALKSKVLTHCRKQWKL